MPRSRKTTSPQLATGSVALPIGTRKGAFILRGNRTRRTWKLSAPMGPGPHRTSYGAEPVEELEERQLSRQGPAEHQGQAEAG
jgi:hypothetical protein